MFTAETISTLTGVVGASSPSGQMDLATTNAKTARHTVYSSISSQKVPVTTISLPHGQPVSEIGINRCICTADIPKDEEVPQNNLGRLHASCHRQN